MFAVLKYVKNNDWKTIKSDWRKYRTLKQYCNMAKQDVNSVLLSLVCYEDEYKKKNKPLKCIRNKYENCELVYDSDGVSACFSTQYCPNFDFYDRASVCGNKNCPYIELNKRYCDAVSRYQHWSREKNNFWARKFSAHVK